jgi:ABC-type branched-subunit amino acid transport system substrate-binding protein
MTGLIIGLQLGAGAAASASTSTGKTLSPIIVGMNAVESGPFAPYEVGTVQWVQAEINYANAHGGIAGHPIHLIVLDYAFDPGKQLLNTETLWNEDHAVAIIGASEPFAQQNQVPTFGVNPPNTLTNHYTTSFNVGGSNEAWSAQTAYWLVKIEHKKIRRVGVIYQTSNGPFNALTKEYWTKLGATFIDMVPDAGPTADCTSTVLKFQAEHVQYGDYQGQETPNCILAEQRLGWKPPLGQGGQSTSEIGEAELIGKPFVGVVAGAPNTLYTGAPINSSPSVADRTYEGMIRKYFPNLANYDNLNGTIDVLDWAAAVLIVQALKGTLSTYGKVTAPLLIKYVHRMKNFDDGLTPPIKSFQPNCQTGSDGTIWGYWHWNAHPTVFRPELYMVPTSGPKWVTNFGWFTNDPCYLSHLADKYYPNG